MLPHRLLLDYGYRRSFLPNYLPNLAVWLDAADLSTVTKDGSNRVSQWNNKGNAGAGHATQASGALQPLYVASAINGLPCIQGRDDGTTKLLSIADSSALKYTEMTAFSVIQRVADLGANEYIAAKFDPGTSMREMGQQITTADLAGTIASTTGAVSVGTATVSSPSIALSTNTIVESYYALGGNMTTRINGTQTGTLAVAGGLFNGTAPYTLLSIKNGATPSQEPFAGYLGEHLFFTRLLSTQERQQVLGYLSAKWGVALA